MKTGMKRTLWGGAAAAAVALMVGGAAFFPTVAQAQATTTTPSAVATSSEQTGQVTPTTPFGNQIDQSAALAEALGITTEELQAAQTEALGAAIDQQVTDGWLTEKQAEALKARLENAQGLTGRMGELRGRFPRLGRGFGPMGDSDTNFNTFLADALGITVDDLQAARTTVFENQLDQAVTDGRITQDQADLMKARRALGEYVAPKLQTAYDDAVKAAVSEGVITQAQADALAAQGGMGLRGFGRGLDEGFGRGMFGGMGGMHGMNGMDGWRMGPGQHGGRGGNDNWFPGMGNQDNQPATPDAAPGSN